MAKFATYASVAFGDLCVLSRYVILIQIGPGGGALSRRVECTRSWSSTRASTY